VKRRSFFAWLAIVALALQAAWPLLSRARPAAPTLVASMCSLDGTARSVEFSGPRLPVEQRSDSFHEHCTLCVFGADRFAVVPPAAMPSLSAALLARVAGTRERPAYFAIRFDSPAAARAPPAAS